LPAAWSFFFLQRLIPPELSQSTRLILDAKLLAFTLPVSSFTVIISGLAPAIQASKVDLNEALKQGGRGGSGTGDRRLRKFLVLSVFRLTPPERLMLGRPHTVQSPDLYICV